MKKKFVGFGELLLRLAPAGYLRFAQANSFELNYTGAEGNMAVALSYMGIPSAIVTKLPNNEIGLCAKRMMDHYGVETNNIVFGGERLGLYYLEKGASQRPSKVIYDRKYSSFAQSTPTDYNWEEIFRDAGWFHFTGITVALSPVMSEICLEACKVAKRMNVTVSCDLNYRKTLWSVEQAQRTMKQLMPYVDVLIANEEDAEKSLGVKANNTDITAAKLDTDGYTALAEQLTELYGFSAVAFTLRESISASVNNWSAMLYQDGKAYLSKKYTIQIVDRVGGGDSFASGLVYSGLNDFNPQKTIEFATAASCLKHTIEYDFNLCTAKEVENLMNGDGSGRISR